MAAISSSPKHIIIAGDAPVQLFLYPPTEKFNPNSRHDQGARAHWFHVGADLLAQLLDAGLTGPNHQVNVDVHKPTLASPEKDRIQSIVELDACELPGQGSQDPKTFRLRRIQQIDTARSWHFPSLADSVHDPSSLSIVVFQETKIENPIPEDNSTNAIALFKKCRPRFLIYHMARPLCRGKIWETVRHGPLLDTDKPDPERLIVVVDAKDLRAEGIDLSYGLSWEKTCEDFVERLGLVGKLVSLATCAHLVVLFGCAGAIYHQGVQVAKPMLFYDPFCVEGEYFRRHVGYVPCIAETFVAGFTKGLTQSPDLSVKDGIELGLQAARRLAKTGLGDLGNKPSLAMVYRASDVMQDLKPDEPGKLILFEIPSNDIAQGSDTNWSLIDHIVGDPAEIARQIVKKGALSPASQVPLAKFGELVLFDRREVESFRTIFNFLREYLAAPMSRPLSIALFGPRGSGKAFAAVQIAEAVSVDHEIHSLRFDLSQFMSFDDLLGAFHSIRDWSLKGSVPIVYFAGIDTTFAGSPLGWLAHLLPVMLSGSFSDHGISRPLGAAVFIFGAAAAKTYEDLRKKTTKSKSDGHPTQEQEFVACLHGFANILGPNQVQHGEKMDRMYPVRRAVILRSLIEKREPNLKYRDKIHIDDGILDALLLVPTYRQGIKSLASIIGMSRLNGCYQFERSALPPPAQLDVYVDHKTFAIYLNGMPLSEQLREDLAEKLHNAYNDERRKTANVAEQKKLTNWNNTDEELRQSSRAHADSIPSKLRIIGCFLSETQEHRKPVESFTRGQIEKMAEIEHERWNAEKLQNQWGKGEVRDVKARKSPFLVPWIDLPEQWKNIDRGMVKSYPKILPGSHKIYEMGPRGTTV
ncbi:hypothetical protein QQZ08_011461 [Neonectria magnoliae]|uniref:Ryanodine receptor Ryr domain-containing protein n=1 Tax=Neonectria magnoliae TaxID=2732573 RepID=A0ABR1H9S8_9HYPO